MYYEVFKEGIEATANIYTLHVGHYYRWESVNRVGMERKCVYVREEGKRSERENVTTIST